MTNLIENGKAKFDYEFQEYFDAGIELLGFEVKSLRTHKANLEGAYIIVRGGEAYIMNLHIPAYQEKNTPKDYESRRIRRLLLNKKEIGELAVFSDTKGLTVIPISMYIKNGFVKVRLAVSRRKKKQDKRESIKKRETDRNVRREYSVR
jgi:SsrA-binding protein